MLGMFRNVFCYEEQLLIYLQSVGINSIAKKLTTEGRRCYPGLVPLMKRKDASVAVRAGRCMSRHLV